MLLSFTSLQAQEIRAYLSNERIRVGDELMLHVEVKGFHKEIRPLFPLVKNADKKGDTQELSLQGGSLTIYSQAYVLEDTGIFTFPAFEVLLDKEEFLTADLTVQAIPAPPMPDLDGEMPAISVEVFLERDTVYLGEQVHVRMFLVMPASEKGNVRVSDFAKARLKEELPKNAFWEEKLARQSLKTLAIERNGEAFLAYPLLETYLFPLKTGIFPFGDQYLSYELRLEKEGASTSEILMGKSYRTVNMLQKAEPKNLIVLPVPETSAETAVGDLALYAKISTEQAATGEPFYMILILEGKANFSTLPEPDFERNSLFSYESPSVNYQFNFADSLAKGQRTYTYQLTGAYPGTYNLGPITYTYFDPLEKRIKKLEEKKVEIVITGSALPELLTNSEGSFYYRAFNAASQKSPFRIPFLDKWSILLVCIALCGFIFGIQKISKK
jgi:hypothetical protein